MQNQEKIVEMFDKIAPTYDRANRILSFGMDVKWRKNACEFVLKKYVNSEVSIVDVACGTGDMIGFWEKSARKIGVKIRKITGVDPSENMLKIAREKFKNRDFRLAYANATGLDSECADVLSISYGIRNVVERGAALAEFNRVLKIGGYVAVLEFTKRKQSGPVAKIRDFYLSKILPRIGGFISKNRAAYEYLPSSIESFLSKEEFSHELQNAGFQVEILKSYGFNTSTLFIAKKVSVL